MKKTLPFLLSLLSTLSFASDQHAVDHHGEKVTSAGIPGHSADVNRTIEVVMSDNMRFSPSQINVKAGETIRFSIKNTGQLKHEFIIGNAEDLKAHAKIMLTMPDMQHEDLNTVSLESEKIGIIIWTFIEAGSIDFACLRPGHWGAGMKGKINVK
jgi:uncharacterized cupredoxin-like copper-binding protein